MPAQKACTVHRGQARTLCGYGTCVAQGPGARIVWVWDVRGPGARRTHCVGLGRAWPRGQAHALWGRWGWHDLKGQARVICRTRCDQAAP